MTNAIALIIFVAATIGLIALLATQIITIADAMLYFALVGVVFYFIFVGINYKHSIYGDRFHEHFDEKDEKNK